MIDPERQYEAIVTEVCATPARPSARGCPVQMPRIPGAQEDLHKAKQALDTARLELLKTQWDDSLYAAYVRYIAAEDALPGGSGGSTATGKRCAGPGGTALAGRYEAKAGPAGHPSQNLFHAQRAEDEYLTLTRLCDALETVRAPSAGFLISLPLYPDDVLRTDRACAVLSQSDLLIAQFP